MSGTSGICVFLLSNFSALFSIVRLVLVHRCNALLALFLRSSVYYERHSYSIDLYLDAHAYVVMPPGPSESPLLPV